MKGPLSFARRSMEGRHFQGGGVPGRCFASTETRDRRRRDRNGKGEMNMTTMTMNQVNGTGTVAAGAGDRPPRKVVWAINEKMTAEGPRSIWIRVGAAFENRDGSI